MSKELIEQLAKEHGAIVHGDGNIFFTNHLKLEAFAKAYQAAAPIDNGIRELSESDVMPFDVEFASGKVGKGCTLKTVLLRLAAQNKAVKTLQEENDSLHRQLGIPTKAEQLRALIPTQANRTEG
jgi:hypothetical protein